MALALGGHVLVGVHHGGAALDGVLLRVIDQGVTVAGGLHCIITLLELGGNSVRLRDRILKQHSGYKNK